MEGGEAGEFQDWEVLHNSEPALVNASDSADNLTELDGFEGDSEGIIRSDYFSLDSHHRYERTASKGDVSEEGSVESDNPSWIDPGLENLPFESKNSRDFWSDSSSDRSVDHKFSDSDVKNELGFIENLKGHMGFERIGEIKSKDTDSGNIWSDSGGDRSGSMKFRDVGKENEMAFSGVVETQERTELPGEENERNGSIMEFGGRNEDCNESFGGETREVRLENETGNENVSIQEAKSVEEEKKEVVWWKLPLELLKYCVFRASPVWSVSMAAAVIAFVILGRRLYKMKHKTRTLQLKVTVDDKKVSQFMSRASRLNEAFSVVRRIPIIRPSLPSAGVTPWPVMSLR